MHTFAHYGNIFIGQIPAVELGSKSPNIFGVIDFAKWPSKTITPCSLSTTRVGERLVPRPSSFLPHAGLGWGFEIAQEADKVLKKGEFLDR